MPLTSRAALFLAPLLLASAPALAQTYPIQLTRPSKPGDAADIHIQFEAVNTNTLTVGTGSPDHDDESLKADLVARRDVQHVDHKGEPDQFTLTIRSFTDADNKPLAAPGDLLTLHRTATAVDVTSTGKPPSDPALKILNQLYPFADPKNTDTDDQFFGTTTARKPGDSWPVNADAIAKSVLGVAYSLRPADISGNVKLQSLVSAPAGPLLRIAGLLKFTNPKPPLPPELVVGECYMAISINGDYPVDPALPAATLSISFSRHLTYTHGDNHITNDLHFTRTETITPIKK